MSNTENVVKINGITVPIEGERNLLELIRKVNIDIPTFCYHSDLSVYGACRLCLIEVEGRGLLASCSTAPEPGMSIKTHTEEIRNIRKIAVELLLANHDQTCPTCERSDSCKLRQLAAQLGIEKVRFNAPRKTQPLDKSTPSLVRDPNKCVLCGDCVRFCAEVQGIGAIDFAYRGAECAVVPAFGNDLAKVECVYCGQCAAVCPTGAITPASETDAVWQAISAPGKTVVAQIAPAVRVAIGEMFGMKAGEISTGQLISALKLIGFDQVFDTTFAADLTVIEEATEFLNRKSKGENLPIFTSCCPGWVKFAEQYFAPLLPNLSSCRSPQQMFGSLAKAELAEKLNIPPKDLIVVSIMPCTAKKFEARRPEFSRDGVPDVDYVLTTQEIGKMIKESGVIFENLQPESMDLPFGFATGAGVIFGNSGGVSEAVLRYAAEKVTGQTLEQVDFHQVRGEGGIREAVIEVGDTKLKLAIVHGLKNARRVAEKVVSGEADWDIIEVMACPGGCIGGAGQPIPENHLTLKKRTQGIYNVDKLMPLHKAQDNPFLLNSYKKTIGEANGARAHSLLHTHYRSRKRTADEGITVFGNGKPDQIKVKVCVGTSCYLNGSQDLLHKLIHYVQKHNLQDTVAVEATFCMEKCDQSPNVAIGDKIIGKATLPAVTKMLEIECAKKAALLENI